MAETELFNAVIKLVRDGGIIVTLIGIIYGGFRRWWVFGYQLEKAERQVEKVEKDRDEWKNLALKSGALFDRVVTVVESRRPEPLQPTVVDK